MKVITHYEPKGISLGYYYGQTLAVGYAQYIEECIHSSSFMIQASIFGYALCHKNTGYPV